MHIVLLVKTFMYQSLDADVCVAEIQDFILCKGVGRMHVGSGFGGVLCLEREPSCLYQSDGCLASANVGVGEVQLNWVLMYISRRRQVTVHYFSLQTPAP